MSKLFALGMLVGLALAPVAEAVEKESLYFMGGPTLSGKATLEMSGSGITSTGTSTTKAHTGFGLEGRWNTGSPFFFSSVVEFNRLQDQDGTDSDPMLSLALMPGLQGTGRLRPWAGVGIGLAQRNHGSGSAGSQSGILLTGPSLTYAFILTPRAGLDLELSKHVALGLYGSYMYSKSGYDLTATSVSTAQSLKIGVSETVNWYSFGVRLGISWGGTAGTSRNASNDAPERKKETPAAAVAEAPVAPAEPAREPAKAL